MINRINISYLSSELLLLSLSLITTVLMVADVLVTPKFVVHLHFYVYMAMLALDFKTHKCFRLFQMWIMGFVFVILAEMILLVEDGNLPSSYIIPFAYLLSANAVLLGSYLLYKPKRMILKSAKYITDNQPYGTVILFMVIVYVLMNYTLAFKAFETGSRGGGGGIGSLGSGTFAGSLFGGLALLLPALIGHYSLKRGGVITGLVLALPVFLLQMLGGTRYKLLFAVLPFFIITGIIKVKRSRSRNLIIAFVSLLLLAGAASFAKDIRNTGINDYLNQQQYAQHPDAKPSLLAKLAKNMSPEGCVYMTRMANDYFSNHDLHYGRESGFVFYFWIPRAIWKDKPTQLDYWLIRKYERVSENHSSASGFTGEIRADFGAFSYFILILWGFLLKYAESYVSCVYSVKEPIFNKVFAATLYPYVFFFVRSPLTASFSFIGECVIYLLMCRLMTERKPLQA